MFSYQISIVNLGQLIRGVSYYTVIYRDHFLHYVYIHVNNILTLRFHNKTNISVSFFLFKFTTMTVEIEMNLKWMWKTDTYEMKPLSQLKQPSFLS